MSIPNYIQPQVRVSQVLDTTPVSPLDRRVALVVGPQYDAYLSGSVPEQDYNGTAVNAGYLKFVNNAAASKNPAHQIDPDSVQVEASGEAFLAEFLDTGSAPKFRIAADSEFAIRLTGTARIAGANPLDSRLSGRPVTVGDIAYIKHGSAPAVRRVVTGLLGRPIPPSAGTNAAADNGHFADGVYNPITFNPGASGGFTVVSAPAGKTLTVTNPLDLQLNRKGSKLNGKAGDRFTVTVVTGGAPGTAVVTFSSASGHWYAGPITTTNDSGAHRITHPDMPGIILRITSSSPLVAGEQFVFDIYQNYQRIGPGSGLNAGEYTGSVDTTVIVQITEYVGPTVAKARIHDTAGALPVLENVEFAEDDWVNIGLGLAIRFPEDIFEDNNGPYVGDVYYINVKAAKASTTDFNGVILSGPPYEASSVPTETTDLHVTFYSPFNGKISKDFWSVQPDHVAVVSDVTVPVIGRTAGSENCLLKNAKLKVYWKALVPRGTNEGPVLIETDSDLEQFGPDVEGNNLGQAVRAAWLGAAGKNIYALRVSPDNASGLEAALKMVEHLRTFMFIVPCLTNNSAIISLVDSHVTAASSETAKRFRRAYIGVDSPGEVIAATGSASVSDYYGENKLVLVSGFDATILNPGDYLDFTVYGRKQIELIISPTEIVVAEPFAAPVSPAVHVKAVRADNAENIKRYLTALASSASSRRVSLIWAPRPKDVFHNNVPGWKISAYIGGLRSKLPPQQGLTRQPIPVVAYSPASYTEFSPSLLNQIAASGVFIVHQPGPGLPVVVRHQLTTRTTEGIMYYEDNVGIVVDELSYRWDDILENYIGRKNANARTAQELRDELTSVLREAVTTTIAEANSVGPMIESYDPVEVKQHPVLKDRFDVSCVVYVATPLNIIKAVIRGSTVQVETENNE